MDTHILDLSECKSLYPFHNGADGELFQKVVDKFGDRRIAERVVKLSLCNLKLAVKLAVACHGNIDLVESLIFYFGKNLTRALKFVDRFKTPINFEPPIHLALHFLSFFDPYDNYVYNANLLLNKLDSDGPTAASFLFRFSFTYEAHDLIKAYVPSKFFNGRSLEFALRGCNGNVPTAVEFATQTGINHLELLYDSKMHPRNAEEFHSRCDNKGPTVTFICTKESCVCAVVNSSWVSDPQGKVVSDPSAYLLRLNPAPQKFPIKSGCQSAFYCHSAYGPCFGDADPKAAGQNERGPETDVAIDFSDDAQYIKGMRCWTKADASYALPKNEFLFDKSGEYNGLRRLVVCNFTINKEIPPEKE